jgi:hypothetical protein
MDPPCSRLQTVSVKGLGRCAKQDEAWRDRSAAASPTMLKLSLETMRRK